MIRVKDHKASLDFYQQTIGIPPTHQPPTPKDPLVLTSSPRNGTRLHPRNPLSRTRPLLPGLPFRPHLDIRPMQHPLPRRSPRPNLAPRHREADQPLLPQRKHRAPRFRPHLHLGRRSRRRVRAVRGERRAVEEATDGRANEECGFYVGSGWILD